MERLTEHKFYFFGKLKPFENLTSRSVWKEFSVRNSEFSVLGHVTLFVCKQGKMLTSPNLPF